MKVASGVGSSRIKKRVMIIQDIKGQMMDYNDGNM